MKAFRLPKRKNPEICQQTKENKQNKEITKKNKHRSRVRACELGRLLFGTWALSP